MKLEAEAGKNNRPGSLLKKKAHLNPKREGVNRRNIISGGQEGWNTFAARCQGKLLKNIYTTNLLISEEIIKETIIFFFINLLDN